MINKIKQYTLSKGGKEMGITWNDIEKYILTPSQFKEFEDWMTGSTYGCVDDTCKTGVVYAYDLRQFLHI